MEAPLFFSSPIGLGHATRDAAVAWCLGIGPRFVSGGAAADLLDRHGLEVADRYVPPTFTVSDGALKRPLGWLWKYYLYYRDCKRTAAEIIGEAKGPAVVISDEDFASLAVAHERRIPSVLITDILETRFTDGIGSMVEKAMNRSMGEIISRCDVVIMPEEGVDEDNIRRTGPIVRQTKYSREELRDRFGFDGDTIVISVGGTAAGEFLIKRALEAVKKARADCEVVIAPGPSLDGGFDGARNMGFVMNLHEVIYAADLVISLAGKSTIDEANAYGTPGIFIPIKGHFEQEENAGELGFSYQDVFRLEEIIEEKISSASTRKKVRADGAQKASRIITDILESQS